jgi:hypothetical protein
MGGIVSTSSITNQVTSTASRSIHSSSTTNQVSGMAKTGIKLYILKIPLLAFNKAMGKTITVPSIPKNVDEYLEMRNGIATSPEGGIAMLVVAMLGIFGY